MRVLSEIVSSLLYGITLPLRSIRLVFSNRKLLVLSLLPIGLSIGVSIWGVSAATAYAKSIGMKLLAQHGYQEGTLTASAASILFTVVMWVLAALVFSFVTNVLASPFNDT